MRFRLEQWVSAAPDEVQAAVVDPDYITHLATLPKLGSPELLSQQRNGNEIVQRVRYTFVGELSSAVRKVVDPERLTWVEVSTVDLAARTTSFEIEPDHYGSLLSAGGTIRILEDGQGAKRVAAGDLDVRVPFVGGKVERAIVSGLEEHAAAEEGALRAWLANR